MLRKLLATALLLATACAPVPSTPTQPPATASAVATVTVQPTPAVPLYYVHPKAQGVGTVDVIRSWCFSKTTVVAIYPYAADWHYDDAAYRECIAKGELS